MAFHAFVAFEVLGLTRALEHKQALTSNQMLLANQPKFIASLQESFLMRQKRLKASPPENAWTYVMHTAFFREYAKKAAC